MISGQRVCKKWPNDMWKKTSSIMASRLAVGSIAEGSIDQFDSYYILSVPKWNHLRCFWKKKSVVFNEKHKERKKTLFV